MDNLNIALQNMKQHELEGHSLEFLYKAEKQYERSVSVLERQYPRAMSATRLLGYSIENGRYKHLLDIGIEANQTTRTLNDILGEERWKKIMAKGEDAEDKLDEVEDLTSKQQVALDRLRGDIVVLKSARDIDEADVAMQRLLDSARRALQIQRASKRPRNEMGELIEDLNDAFEFLMTTDNEREKKRAIKYLHGVILDVESGLNDVGRFQSPQKQRVTINPLATNVEDITSDFRDKKVQNW